MKRRYTPDKLALDLGAMLKRRRILVRPELVSLVSDFCYQQVVANRRRVPTEFRGKRAPEPPNREQQAVLLATVYHEKRQKSDNRFMTELLANVRFPSLDPRDVDLVHELQRALEARIRERDRRTRTLSKGGWKHRFERDAAMEKARVLRKVLLVARG